MEIISCKAAASAGLKKYFTGRPCLRGHIAERTLNGSCIMCRRNRQKRDRAANPERYLAYSRSYNDQHREDNRLRALECRHADPEKSRRASAKWRTANRQKSRDIALAWQKQNPEKHALHVRNRKARLLNAVGQHTAADIDDIFEKQNHKCAYCGIGLLKQKRHVDHIIPLILGGANDRRNLQILCPPCNSKKHAKHPIEYAESLGLLL